MDYSNLFLFHDQKPENCGLENGCGPAACIIPPNSTLTLDPNQVIYENKSPCRLFIVVSKWDPLSFNFLAVLCILSSCEISLGKPFLLSICFHVPGGGGGGCQQNTKGGGVLVSKYTPILIVNRT